MGLCYHSIMGSNAKVETTIRLAPDKHRRLRMAVAERGLSLQKAVEQAIDLWLARLKNPEPSPPDFLRWQGALQGSGILQEHEREHREEILRDDQGT